MNEEERYRTVDLPFYKNEIAPILPPEILDFHTHAWSCADWREKPWKKNDAGKYMVLTEEYPIDALLHDGRRVFPDKDYEAVVFGNPTPAVDREKDTAFIMAAGKHHGVYPLMLAGKDFGVHREQIEATLLRGNFLGYKVFLNWYGNDYGDVRVEDMLSANEMELADEKQLIVLLHVPRNGRLADPVIQEGVQWLAKDYPNAQIVLAHCGRCYLPAEMKKAIGAIRDLQNVYMDTSMVMDPLVLQMAMDTIGSGRLVYATDFPVAAMRGRRIRVMDHWVDVVLEDYPQSAFRVQSDDIRATFMALEIVVAIRDAAEKVGLSSEELSAIFYANGVSLLERVMIGEQVTRVRESWVKTV